MSIACNYDDAISQLQLAGLVLDKPLILDGRIQRWKAEGEDRERRGWTRLREWTSKAGNTYLVGNFGIWHGNSDGNTKIELPQHDNQKQKLSHEEISAIRAAQKEAARKLAEERNREAKQAASWAASVWNKCAPCVEHDYLTRKAIQPHGTRVLEDTKDIPLANLDESNHYRLHQAVGALVVPMHDELGNVCGIQFIYPRGHKRREKIQRDKEFWPSGMAMGGTFGVIGPVMRSGVLLVAEGFATAASLHEASGQSVAYTFSANNLAKAGKLLRKKNPRLRLLFCADDDYLTVGNPGVTAAVNATAEIELAAWIKPDFMLDGTDLREGKKLTDFNDLALLTGVPLMLANQVNTKLDELQWRDATVSVDALPQGGGEAGRRSAVSVMTLDDVVARFVPLDDGTGKFLFDTWTNKIAHRDQMITLLPAGMRGDDVKRHPVWSQRGAYYLDQVGFDPAGTDKNILCNLWGGWPTTPKPGKCTALLSLLEYLCTNEQNHREIYQWVLKWLAYPIQHPGAKMRTALVFHGPQGAGKNLFFESVMAIYGEYGRIIDQASIEDKFNDWASRKLFLIADEVVARAELFHIKNKLKHLITGDWIRINPKNVAAHDERNHVNMVFLSNEHQPVVLEKDDRRSFVIWTPEKLTQDFYADVRKELDAGGIAALHDFLLNLDLGDFSEHSKPPMTDAKRDLIDVSMGSTERFVQEWRSGDLGIPFCPCSSSDLYSAYTRWCKTEGVMRPRENQQFIGYVSKLPGWFKGHKDTYSDLHFSGKTTRRRMVLPSDDDLNAAALAGRKDFRKPEDVTQSEWLTECWLTFSEAISNQQSHGANA